MAESFTDEELELGFICSGMDEAAVQAFVNRLRATCIRLMDERHFAEARYKALRATSIEKLRMDESERVKELEARLAELVSEVREWIETVSVEAEGLSGLAGILDKYEGGEHG